MKYNRSLDGVRGIAILMVVFSHFNYESLLREKNMFFEPFLSRLSIIGVTGVDLFFLLSGYLITTILLESKHKNLGLYLKNFYVRRFLRISPLYYLVLFFVFIVIPLYVTYDQAAIILLKKQLFVWTYLSNLPGIGVDWDSSSFFWLGHFWSLAVEEHFYLMWPLVVYFLDNKSLKVVSLMLIVLSIFSFTIYTFNPKLIFFDWPTVTRGGGLSVGSLIAIYAYEKNDFRYIRNNPFLFLLFFIVFFAVLLSPRSSYIYAHLYYASWAFYAICFIFLINLKNGFLYDLLCSRVLVFLGVISYGLYVYHGVLRPRVNYYIEGLFALYSTGFVLFDLFAYSLLALFFYVVVAAVSYYFYESFFLKLKKFF